MAKEKEDHKVRNVAIGAAVAGVAGYVAGVLTAPKSGKETRKDIRNKAIKAKSEAEKKLKSMHSELNDLITTGKKHATTASATAKKELQEAIEKATVAKTKAKEMLSALHEGGADDQDLKQAVTEASSAIKHLKTYLKKNA